MQHAVGSTQVRWYLAPGGHIGLFIGRQSQAEYWTPILAQVHELSQTEYAHPETTYLSLPSAGSVPLATGTRRSGWLAQLDRARDADHSLVQHRHPDSPDFSGRPGPSAIEVTLRDFCPLLSGLLVLSLPTGCSGSPARAGPGSQRGAAPGPRPTGDGTAGRTA